MSPLLYFFWFIWEAKYILFWLYLWQLKEYHTGRFADHFRTSKGKKLLFSFEQIFKLVLLILLFAAGSLFAYLVSILFLVYFVESLIFARNIYLKNFKKPKRTFKTIFLTLVSLAVVVLFLIFDLKLENVRQVAGLAVFDILTPLIISVIVLLFQPFFVFARNIKLKKAKVKMEKMKLVSGVKVVAITGSFGKTSTKEFLTTILSKKFKVLSTKEHQNSEIGIANCILDDLKPSHQIFIAEVGAYNKGKLKEVCSVIKPKIGIVTGVNEQHLALFGSLENLLSAEGGGELADVLEKENGLLVVNGDNKYCLDLYKKSENLKERIYSARKNVVNADIFAYDIEVKKTSVSFVAETKNKEMNCFQVNVLGKQNVQNLLGAILVAKELGMDFGEISDACKNIKQEQAGMVLKQGKHGIDIVDSSYSANPDGVYADLDYFSIFENKKVIVMPCLIELGEKSSEIHEKIGKKIGEICDLAIITSKDKFKEIEKGFMEAKPVSVEASAWRRNILLCEKPQEIYSAITLFCKSGDAVLLEGRVPAGLLKLLTK
jgi:UDP-N-acetylmuramoyl-tripeptide--D-alanyl-D-alanine ligase